MLKHTHNHKTSKHTTHKFLFEFLRKTPDCSRGFFLNKHHHVPTMQEAFSHNHQTCPLQWRGPEAHCSFFCILLQYAASPPQHE